MGFIVFEEEAVNSLDAQLEDFVKRMGTIRAWIRKETIPFYKVGRQYKFKVSEVDAWVESGQSAKADKNNTVEEN